MVYVARLGGGNAAPVRKDQEPPPCWTEPPLAGSKTDPLLVKAQPIKDGGSASVKTHLRDNKHCSTVEREGEVR